MKMGCKWGANTCSSAAENGHLKILKYAHENGCKWDEWVCYYALKYGNLEILKYLHENGKIIIPNIVPGDILLFEHNNRSLWVYDI